MANCPGSRNFNNVDWCIGIVRLNLSTLTLHTWQVLSHQNRNNKRNHQFPVNLSKQLMHLPEEPRNEGREHPADGVEGGHGKWAYEETVKWEEKPKFDMPPECVPVEVNTF